MKVVKELNRLDPVGPPRLYQTYRMAQPIRTHFRRATCAEVECIHYLAGWQSVCDIDTELGLRQADYIANRSGRKYLVDRHREHPNMVRFTFPPGQTCFEPHNVSLEREPFFSKRPGDHRVPLSPGSATLMSAADWVDDFANNQIRIVERLQRG